MRTMARQWEAIKYINILVVLFSSPFCCCVRMMQKFMTQVINYWPFFPPFYYILSFKEYITSVMCHIYTRSGTITLFTPDPV